MQYHAAARAGVATACAPTNQDHTTAPARRYAHAAHTIMHLSILLLAQAGRGVGHAHVQLASALDDGAALGGRHVVGDLSAVLAVVHEQELQVLHVAHDELLEAVGQGVAGLLVAAEADLGLGDGATEAAAQTAVDTAGSTPGLGHAHEAVTLEAAELVPVLLHDLHALQRLGLNHLDGCV
mmetsp:Transcript_13770/g.19460  ORF Transcript_13770/g.19460 Transcript_13770/m.19460 type:complete len:181 (+) Transcript_13770:167-709(+)